MINRVFLIGNLTKDAEAIATSGRAMTTMRLATNSRWRNSEGITQESVEFHSVVAFGKLADIAAQYCLKGRRIWVEGKLRTRHYDGSDGSRRTTTEVIADTVRLLQSRPSENEADSDAASEPAPLPVAV